MRHKWRIYITDTCFGIMTPLFVFFFADGERYVALQEPIYEWGWAFGWMFNQEWGPGKVIRYDHKNVLMGRTRREAVPAQQFWDSRMLVTR